MTSRRRMLAVGAGALLSTAALAAVPLTAGAAKAKAKTRSPAVITVVERAVTDTTAFIGGGSRDVTGNVLTFHNQLYDRADKQVVGSDLGFCIRVMAATPKVTPADGSYSCEWTNFLARGQITVSGPFYDSHNSTLAITGGTGAYSHARGAMNLISRKGGTEYLFVFHLVP